LKGKGKQARQIVVHDANRLEEAPVEALIIQAVRAAKLSVEPKSYHRRYYQIDLDETASKTTIGSKSTRSAQC
jgi:hypothetical protein